MPYTTSPVDGARLFYTDYQPATSDQTIPAYSPANLLKPPQPIPPNFTLVFLHGWPMSSEMYTHLLLPLSQNHSIRCIAPDRRGFGRSDWSGPSGTEEITYETFAKDTVAVLKQANIKGQWAWVAASMGPGESLLAQEMLASEANDTALQCLGKRCKGFVWLGPSLPFPLKCERYPTAPGREIWDGLLGALREDRVGFVKVAIHGVFGNGEATGLGIDLPPSKIEYFEDIVRQADALAIERCPMIITGTDFTEKLKKLDRRVLVLHGDSDQGMPASASAQIMEKLVPEGLCEVKIYEKAAHGLYLTHAGKVLEDILGFVVSKGTA